MLLGAHKKKDKKDKLRRIRTTAEDAREIAHQQVATHSRAERLSIKVVVPINCDATLLLQQAKQGEKRDEERGSATLPCGCALPHIADAAFESLGGVPEGADATVPVAVIRGLFGLSFWPYRLDKMFKVKLVFDIPSTYCMNSQKGDCYKRNTSCNTQAT